MEGSDEQSPASLNLDSVASTVCKQTSVSQWIPTALGLFEFHSSLRAHHEREKKLICSCTWNDFWERVRHVLGGGGCSTPEGDPGQNLKSCMNNIKASAGNPLAAAAAAADGMWWEWICRLLNFIHYFPFTASHVTSHILLRRVSEGEILYSISGVLTKALHTHSLLVACMHTHTLLRVTWPVTLGVLGFDRKSIQLTDECS